jgi:hypothetical protein
MNSHRVTESGPDSRPLGRRLENLPRASQTGTRRPHAVLGGASRTIYEAKQASVSEAFRILTARGLRSHEAGNVTAYSLGLSPIEGGWSVGEIERLLFTSYLLAQGHIGS